MPVGWVPGVPYVAAAAAAAAGAATSATAASKKRDFSTAFAQVRNVYERDAADALASCRPLAPAHYLTCPLEALRRRSAGRSTSTGRQRLAGLMKTLGARADARAHHVAYARRRIRADAVQEPAHVPRGDDQGVHATEYVAGTRARTPLAQPGARLRAPISLPR